MPKVKKAKVQKSSESSRKVLYPEVSLVSAIGTNAISGELAKNLLGWQTEEDSGLKFKADYLLKDLCGNKVRCSNNISNRPIYSSTIATLKQEHLKRRWRFNGEAVIIGKTGQILNGQHTLISLVLAIQEWENDKERWAKFWSTPPTMDKAIVYGIDEGDDVVNTMDTCKPRSLADVVYRSEHFKTAKPGLRSQYAKATDYAIKLMWHRTGASLDAWGTRRTHAESLDFISRHSRILKCVKHICEEDAEGKLSRFSPAGYLAGLMYLMGCSSTDPDKYRTSEAPAESELEWDNWDKAQQFFVELAKNHVSVQAVRKEYGQLMEKGPLSQKERWAILSNAWNSYSDSGRVDQKDLALQFDYTEEGGRKLAEHPSVGGIDFGEPNEADEVHIPHKDPSEDEIEERKTALHNKRKAAKTTLKPTKKGKEWQKNDVAWVFSPDGKHYLAKLADEPYECDNSDPRVMVTDNEDGEWEVMLKDLHETEPKPVEKLQTTPAKTKKAKSHKVGGKVWITPKKGEPWQGTVVEINPTLKVAKVRIETGFQGAGQVEVVRIADLSLEQPVAA